MLISTQCPLPGGVGQAGPGPQRPVRRHISNASPVTIMSFFGFWENHPFSVKTHTESADAGGNFILSYHTPPPLTPLFFLSVVSLSDKSETYI